MKKPVKEFWTIGYKGLRFKISPTGFKHTGLFPEQASNWDFMANKIKESKRDDLRILNLFAYTGGATMACSKAGAKEVVHVDASKGMIQWAKENMQLSNLQDHTIRFIVDDCIKFVKENKEEEENTMASSWIHLVMVEVLMVNFGNWKKNYSR